MYLMYIDESGNTATFQENGSKILVLTGCIIEEDQKLSIEQKFRAIKKKFYFDPDIEIKSNYLRYANPDITNISSPIKLKDRHKYDELEKEIAGFMQEIRTVLISVVIDKKAYWVCIIDPREGTVEKKFIDKEIDKIHNLVRWSEGSFWKKCPNIIERALFSTSDLTVGIQLADLYCYPVYHIFEYDKTKKEYWRFFDISFPKLYHGVFGVIGSGLKFFPDETKKNFRFFS